MQQNEKQQGEQNTAPEQPVVPSDPLNTFGDGKLQPIRNKKQMRNWWIKTILLVVLVALSIALLFTLGEFMGGDKQLKFRELIKKINYPLFALMLGVVLLYYFMQSANYSYFLKVYTGKFHLRTSIKAMFLGKYYDGITPLATGGQPFQIYYLHKKKIPHGVATAVPILRYFTCTIVFIIVAAVLMGLTPICNLPREAVTITIRVLAWASLGINALIPVAIALFSIFPTFCKRVIVAIVKGLSKLRIVKNRFAVTEKYVREMTEYSNTMKMFFKQFFKFIPLLVLCVIECALYVTIPYFIVIAIANVTPTFELALQISVLVMISRYSAILIPTPGNSVAAEAATSLVFITLTGIDSVLGWVVLMWRFVTYYLYLLTGIGLNIFEIIRGAIRNKRERKLLAENPEQTED